MTPYTSWCTTLDTTPYTTLYLSVIPHWALDRVPHWEHNIVPHWELDSVPHREPDSVPHRELDSVPHGYNHVNKNIPNLSPISWSLSAMGLTPLGNLSGSGTRALLESLCLDAQQSSIWINSYPTSFHLFNVYPHFLKYIYGFWAFCILVFNLLSLSLFRRIQRDTLLHMYPNNCSLFNTARHNNVKLWQFSNNKS